MESFEALPFELLKSTFLYGYKTPTPVQREVIPAMQRGESLVVQSATGSGKTAAFVLGSCLVASAASPALQVMVVSPTRELSLQTCGVFARLTGLKVALVTSQVEQFGFVKSGAQVLVTTLERAGKLFDRSVRVVIFDEFDLMLEEKPGLVEKVAPLCRGLQCVLCSATFSGAGLAAVSALFKIDRRVNISEFESASLAQGR